MPGAAVASNKMAEDDMKYRAKDALQTIKRAEEHKADKELMKHVKQCAKQERKTLDKI